MSILVASSPHTPIPYIPPSSSEALPAVPLSFEDLGDDLSIWCDRLVNPDGTENLELAEQYADTGVALEAFGIMHRTKTLAYPGPSLLWAVENGYSGIAEIFLNKGASFEFDTYQYPLRDMSEEGLLEHFREGTCHLPPLRSTVKKQKGWHVSSIFELSRKAIERHDQKMLAVLRRHKACLDHVYMAEKMGLASVDLKYKPLSAYQTLGTYQLNKLGLLAIQEENIEFLDQVLDIFRRTRALVAKENINRLLCYAAAKAAPHVLEHLARKYDMNCYAQMPTYGLSGSPLEMALAFNNYANVTILLNNGGDLAYSYCEHGTYKKEPTLFHLLCFRRYAYTGVLPQGKMLEMRKELLEFLQSHLTEESVRLCLRHYLFKAEPEKDHETIFLLLNYYKNLNPHFEKLDEDKYLRRGKGLEKFEPSVTFLFLHQDIRDFFGDHPGYHAFLERQGLSKVHLAAWDNDVECLSQLVEEGCELSNEDFTISPLAVASYSGSLDAIELILATGPIGQRTLHESILLACKAGQLEVIKRLETLLCDSLNYDQLFSEVMGHGYLHCMKYLYPQSNKRPGPIDWSCVKNVETYEYIRDVVGITPHSPRLYFKECFKTCSDDVLQLLIKDCVGESSSLKRTMGTALSCAIRQRKSEAFMNEILERGPELTDDHVNYARSHGYPAIAAKIQRRLHPEVVMIRA